MTRPSRETAIVSALHHVDPQTGAVGPAIHPASTFARDDSYALVNEAHGYARDESPAFVTAERMLCKLEGGADAMLFASGMAAAAAVFQALSPGDHVVAPQVMYWGLRDWLIEFCERWGLALDLYDPRQPGDLEGCLIPGQTRLVWVETPCNPTWEIIDIAAAASAAHAIGAAVAVDSTVATPVLTRPLELGADIVMHSATKYLNGHGDVVAGALVAAREDELWRRIHKVRGHGGAIPGAFEAWLLQRGMRTLFLRVERSSRSALDIARHFEGHAAVEAVHYPGLSSHLGHETAGRQMHGGYGGMLSLRIRGGAEAALAVARRCRVFVRATSLGSVESLIEHRHTIEGPASPIPADMLRLSVGIETVDDLIGDLEQALAAPGTG